MSEKTKRLVMEAVGVDREKPLLVHFDLNHERYLKTEKATDNLNYIMAAIIRDEPPKAAIRGGQRRPVKMPGSPWGKRGNAPRPRLKVNSDMAIKLWRKEDAFMQLQGLRDIKMGEVLALQSCIANDNELEVKKLSEEVRRYELETDTLAKLTTQIDVVSHRKEVKARNEAFKELLCNWNEYLLTRMKHMMSIAEYLAYCFEFYIHFPMDLFDNFEERKREDLELLEKGCLYPPRFQRYVYAGLRGKNCRMKKMKLFPTLQTIEEVDEDNLENGDFTDGEAQGIFISVNIFERDEESGETGGEEETNLDTLFDDESVDEPILESREKENTEDTQTDDDSVDEDDGDSKWIDVDDDYENDSGPQSGEGSGDEADGDDDEWTEVDDDFQDNQDAQSVDGSTEASDDEEESVELDDSENNSDTQTVDEDVEESDGQEENWSEVEEEFENELEDQAYNNSE